MKDPSNDEENTSKTQSKPAFSVLDAFDLLKTSTDDTKAIGGAKLISILGSKEDEKNTQYALTRLIRSLGANNPEIRTGYFATLVAFFNQFQNITVTKVLDNVKKSLQANKSSKSEVGDTALGKILVCSAIFRSKLILRCSEEEQKSVLILLLSASDKKSYLKTIGYSVLLDFANMLNEEQFSTILWPNVKDHFKKDLKEHCLDSLYFIMVAKNKFPKAIKIKKVLGVSEILSEDTIHTVCEIIMTGIDMNSSNHPIFTMIGKEMANSQHLQLFWTSGIDSQLVKHKRNKELVAINILTSILNNLKENVDVIPELLSKNFFSLFMDWFKGLQTASKIRTKHDDEDDHKIMIKKQKELLNALAKSMKSPEITSQIRVAVLNKLLFEHGEMTFTETTGTNIVKSIVSDMDKDGVKKMAKLFKDVLFNTSMKQLRKGAERPWFNNERLKSAELLSYLVNHECMKDDVKFKLKYMKILMFFGFFRIGSDESTTISTELAGSIKACFYKCFGTKFSSVDTLVEVLHSLSDFINTTISQETVRVKIEKQFSNENLKCWETLNELCDTIIASKKQSKVDKVFLILLYQLGLYLFSEPDHIKMAKSSISELKSCYEHYKSGESNKMNVNDDEDEPEWIEVIVEVLLSILSTESSILRSIVQCVFRLLWEYLTPSTIGQIVSVLDPESESNPLMQESDDDDEDSSEDDDSDDGEKNGAVDDSDNNEDGSDDEKDDDEVQPSDDDDDEDMKMPDQLRMAVQQALGSAATASDAESIDADMIDEEEGRKLDDALAEAFKQFQQGKVKKTKKDRKDKKILSDFRIRVLDLVDIYLEKDPAMDICLSMIAPLQRCLEFCLQDNQFAELASRTRKTIKNLSKIRKFTTNDVEMGVLCDYFKSTVDKGSKSHFVYQAIGDTITQFATFIIHCSMKINAQSKNSPLLNVVKEYLQSYFTNRNCLLPIIFFHNILQTEWDANYDLIPLIVDSIFDPSIRHFRRNEGVELIAGFFRALKRTKPTSDKQLKKLNKLEIAFENKLKSSLDSDKFEAKKNFIVTLKKLVNTIRDFHNNTKIKSNINFEELLSAINSFKGVVKGNVNPPKENGERKKSKKKKRKADKSVSMTNGDIKKAKKEHVLPNGDL